MSWQSDNAPPEGLGPSDLCGQLLIDMGVARTQTNMIAASEALLIKGKQPKFTTATAYTFILKRWKDYQASDHYQSKYKSKAAAWLSEGTYDNPAFWGGRPDLAHQEKPKQPGVKEWEADRKAHPENYVPVSDLLDEMRKIFSAKVMK